MVCRCVIARRRSAGCIVSIVSAAMMIIEMVDMVLGSPEGNWNCSTTQDTCGEHLFMQKTKIPDMSQLAGLPRAEPFEAPSSWLTRAALSQAVTPLEFLRYMGFPKNVAERGDLDLALISPHGRRVLATADPTRVAFPVAERIFSNIRTISPRWAILLHDAHGRSRFGYCVMCWRQAWVAYLPVHCRFATWRYCPLHGCLIEKACPHCGSPVVLPFDMASAGERKDGVAYLSLCAHCGKKLTAAQPLMLEQLALTVPQRQALENGRVLLAALYHGRASINGSSWQSLRVARAAIRICSAWAMSAFDLKAERDLHLRADNPPRAP